MVVSVSSGIRERHRHAGVERPPCDEVNEASMNAWLTALTVIVTDSVSETPAARIDRQLDHERPVRVRTGR